MVLTPLLNGFVSDCWERKSPPRDATGQLTADPTRFPEGMKALGEYIHGKGASFGVYTAESERCVSSAGIE